MDLVVTLGNRFRGDDGVGPAVAERLRALGVPVTEIEDPTRLADLLGGAARAVIVDALISGAPVGSVVVLDVTNRGLPTEVSTSSHTISLAQGLELARTLGAWGDRVVVVGVEIEQIHPVPGLHDEVAAAIGIATETVLGLVDLAG